MAQIKGRPTSGDAPTLAVSLKGLDTKQHPLHTLPARAVRPFNYAPTGPSTRTVAKPLDNPKVK